MPVTVERLAGYGERDFDADLARWFPDRPSVALSNQIRPVAPFLERLPGGAAAALEGFDRKVRSGTLPRVLDVSDDSYGFEFADNGCDILDSDYETALSDDDVWSIGFDGGGNYYVVLTNGQVAVWFHEEQVIEADTRFDNLDVFLYAIVRYQAVRAGVLNRADVEADLRALGQPGIDHPDVGLLAYLPR
ncbi:hypothetical protein KZ829_18845 [Actinoplanes hulinensis]|uniref:SUKH-4 immunity protein of toxin-antitoxin system n=1 Tax=Actinoplanes hulinensis TaxID=1144547 RepID=A0ABS7B679_9ACTN|nr:hypothetical protein [Actinoplanes hulinensis]MBW6435803.1 hypothetical protein [Actinoplanes hulinensis]